MVCGQSMSLRKEEFRNKICTLIRERYPNYLTEPEGELSFRMDNGAGCVSITRLDRGWEDLCKHPEELDYIVEQWVKSAEAGANFRVEPDRIIPCIQPSQWLQAQPEEARPFMWTEPYNSEFIIAYAQYQDALMYGFPPNCGVRREELWERSLANLRRMSPNIQAHGAGGLFLLTADNMWDSSLMLLDELRHHPSLGEKGGRVMAVPSRDMFFIADASVPGAIFRLALAATAGYRTSSYSLSPRLFAWGDGKWEPLDPQLEDEDHVIRNPEALPDEVGRDASGMCVFPLHFLGDVTLDARTVYRLFRQLDTYLRAVSTPEYRSRFGDPTPETHCIEVRAFHSKDPALMELLNMAAYWLQDGTMKETCVSMRIILLAFAH